MLIALCKMHYQKIKFYFLGKKNAGDDEMVPDIYSYIILQLMNVPTTYCALPSMAQWMNRLWSSYQMDKNIVQAALFPGRSLPQQRRWVHLWWTMMKPYLQIL